MIIHRSILLYVLLNSIIIQAIVMMTAPAFIGISNNISKAIAPPSISASEVDMLANIADPNIGRETVLRIYLLVASARHNPVTIPK